MMTMQLVYDNQYERRANLREINDPSWSQIEEAIRRLDARVYTEVCLDGPGQLVVGGGAGQYFVSIFTKDEHSLVVVDRSKPESERIHLVTGGQRVVLPARQVVGLELALKAARTFLEHECPDDTLSWSEE